MFASTFHYSIDDKGRLSIPSAYRDLLRRMKLPEQLYLTLSLDQRPAIWAYPLDRFQEVIGRMADDPGDQDFFRKVMAATHLCLIDKQCRVVVPGFLRGHAGITRDVTIVGVGKRFDVWDRARYQDYERRELAAVKPPTQMLR